MATIRVANTNKLDMLFMVDNAGYPQQSDAGGAICRVAQLAERKAAERRRREARLPERYRWRPTELQSRIAVVAQ